ncbi:MAG: AAA family ATPase [Bacilli bacterium]|nr:AAA family ATPase [Bacilli bacterium]
MITTFTGPMHSGKTAAMISTYNKIWNKKNVLCFKPAKDSRDLGVMKSKDFEVEIPAICINKFEDILGHVNEKDNIRTVFIDEAQMIEGNVSVLSYLSIVMDIDVYVSGLNMTSEQDPFLVMPLILAISDDVKVIKASCYDCGRDAPYTYFDGEKKEAIVVGDEGYIPLCSRCIEKRRGKEKMAQMLLKRIQVPKKEES